MRSRAVAPLVLLLVSLAATGCGEREEPLGGGVDVYPVRVADARGEEVDLVERPERIVALAPSAAELAGELGAGERVVGVPANVTVAGAIGAPRVTRPSGLVDVAAAVRLKPDLLLASSSTSADALDTVARRTGAAVYVQPDRSIRDVLRAVHDLGFLLGEPARARLLAASLREELAAVEEAVRARAPVRVFVDMGLLVPPPSDSLVADLVRRAGGEPLATERAGVPAAPCAVLSLRPDVVLRVRDALARLPDTSLACRRRPNVDVPVVRIQESLASRAGPRIGQALETIARALHPDAF
jgi:iron complex transport system substrate-binding protein